MPAAAPARVVLVTGSAKRLGREIALALARDGWQVAVHYRDSVEDAHRTTAQCAQLSGKSESFRANLANETAVRRLLPAVIQHFGHVDAVVNSASTFEHDTAQSFGFAAMEKHMRSNAGAAMMMGTPLSGTMTTLLASVSASQIVSPRLVVGLTYDVSRLDGFQENPYRSVITAEGLVMERHPQTRRRQAWAASARWFVGRTATTVIASHRVYVDDWGIVAHTPELRVVQEAGDAADVAIRYRYHHQSAADFYLPSYPSADPSDFPYLTDDVKLSAFTSHTIGFKVGVFGRAFGLDGALGDARGEVEFEYVDQNNRFGNAGIANAALILPIR